MDFAGLTAALGLNEPASLRDVLVRRAPHYVAVLLAIMIAGQVLAIVRDFVTIADRPAKAVTAREPGRPRVRSFEIAQLVNAHLFGSAPSTAAQAGEAPRTTLQLVLTGVIAKDDPLVGLAILGENPTASRLYAVGQGVPGGAKLHAVYGDRVILDRNGALESLLLPRLRGASQPSGPTVAAGFGSRRGSWHPAVRRTQVVSSDMAREVVKLQTFARGGKQQGYRVFPEGSRTAFGNLGLQSGDLITSINNIPLDDPRRSDELYNLLGSGKDVRATVIRNGRPKELVVNLSQAMAENGSESPVVTDGSGLAPPSTPSAVAEE